MFYPPPRDTFVIFVIFIFAPLSPQLGSAVLPVKIPLPARCGEKERIIADKCMKLLIVYFIACELASPN